MKRRDVNDEAGAHVGVEAGVDDLEGPVRFRAGVDLLQAGKKAGFGAERGSDGVIGMARLPVGKNNDPRTELTQNTHNRNAIFKIVGDGSVRQIQRMTPADSQDAGGFISLTGALISGAARAGFALSQIENRRAQATRSHAQEGSSAGLFHIVAMSSDGENVGSEVDCLCGHRNQLTVLLASVTASM